MTDMKDDEAEVEVLELPKTGKWRVFTLERKPRVLGDCDVPGVSVSEVARRHGISPSLRFRWRQMHEAGGLEGLGAEEPVVPESEYRQLQNRVRELERLLGKKTMETEILKDALEVARTKNSCCADADMRGRTRDVRDCACARRLAFELARETSEARDDARCRHVETRDDALACELRPIVAKRGSYGYRRVTALLAKERIRRGLPPVNHKRVYRVMKSRAMLLECHTGKPTRTHGGKIITFKSDLRWFSDAFEIRYWNGECVQVAFALDCCDREVLGFVATSGAITGEMIRDLMLANVETRFGACTRTLPHRIQWLSDNGPPYTGHETREFGAALGFVVCNTPSYSPESNGMTEAFVKKFKRDDVYLNELRSAAHVLARLQRWFDDYNQEHPHRGLGMRSPRDFRALQQALQTVRS